MTEKLKNVSLELASFLVALPVRSVAAAGVGYIPLAPLFQDDTGRELQKSPRPWYRSKAAVIGLLLAAWVVHVARYFEQDALTPASAMR